MSMHAINPLEDLQTISTPQQCPLGYLVLEQREVDPVNGCGYRHCYPSACAFLKQLIQ